MDRQPETEHDLPRTGDVVAGKYRVESMIGAGGMGVVFAALDTSLGRRVAIKLLQPHKAERDGASARFLREARAAASIQSEHVVRVYEVGTLPSAASYIVMEHLAGADLAQVLAQRGGLPIDEAVDYLLEACEALAEAHGLGIVHRDLKPQNLFVTTRLDGSSCVKVLDFGISKALDEASPRLTSTGMVMGTPLYMSPEQVRSLKSTDHRTDIWALGAIVFELLTASPIYEAPTTTALCAKIATDPPARLRERRPHAPADLEAVILRCLHKDPDGRYQDVAALADALAPFASARGKLSASRVARIVRGGSVAPPQQAAPAPFAPTFQSGPAIASSAERDPTTAGSTAFSTTDSAIGGVSAAASGPTAPSDRPLYGSVASYGGAHHPSSPPHGPYAPYTHPNVPPSPHYGQPFTPHAHPTPSAPPYGAPFVPANVPPTHDWQNPPFASARAQPLPPRVTSSKASTGIIAALAGVTILGALGVGGWLVVTRSDRERGGANAPMAAPTGSASARAPAFPGVAPATTSERPAPSLVNEPVAPPANVQPGPAKPAEPRAPTGPSSRKDAGAPSAPSAPPAPSGTASAALESEKRSTQSRCGMMQTLLRANDPKTNDQATRVRTLSCLSARGPRGATCERTACRSACSMLQDKTCLFQLDAAERNFPPRF